MVIYIFSRVKIGCINTVLTQNHLMRYSKFEDITLFIIARKLKCFSRMPFFTLNCNVSLFYTKIATLLDCPICSYGTTKISFKSFKENGR